MKLASIIDHFNNNLGRAIPGFEFNNNMFRDKSLWAIGTEWVYKGNPYRIANYGDWKTGEKFTFRNFNPREESKSFNKKFQESVQEFQAKQKFEQEKKWEDCREKWKPIFDNALIQSEPHEYLKNKGISSNHSARIHPDYGSLLIPAYNSQRFVGVQMIFEQDSVYEKRFSSGIELTGSFSFVGEIGNASHIYVAEGFATAATIYELTGHPCLITFNCHNIYPAIQEFRRLNKFAKIIICADNDKNRINPRTGKKENIGVICSRKAQKKLSNTIVKIPEFPAEYDNKTDFNDLFQINEDSALEQLEFSPGDFVDVIPLGRQGKKFYYFSTETKQVQDLSADQHTKNYFLTMAEPRYWADLYGYQRDKDGNETNKPCWESVQEKLLQKQRSIGFFNPKNIRGYGCWFDNRRFIVNLGNSLFIDNEISERIDSKYLYESNDPLDIDLDNPLSISECQKIISVFKKLNYKNPGDYIYLVSWIAQAQIFGAMDWRFQVWLTGERGSGKTEILRMISQLVFRSEIYQSVTAASIRQHLKSNAMPMIIDEAEPNNPNERSRMDAVIEVIRQCSSRLNTKSLRGTASGTALEYNINSCFLLGSIQTYLPTMADRSRFFEIEMKSNSDQDPETWNKIQSEFHEIMDYAPRLFARMVKMVPLIRKNVRYAKKLLTQDLIEDKRAADQLAAVIGVLSVFYSDGDVEPHFIAETAETLNLGASDYENENAEDEAGSCLDAIMDSIIDRTAGDTIASCVNEGKHIKLASVGIKRFDNGELFIQTGNVELRKMLRESMYSNLRAVLKRHSRFKKVGVAKINNRSVKGVYLCGE